MSRSKKSTKPSRVALANKTIASLQKLESALGLDFAQLPAEVKRATVSRTLATSAIASAARIIKQYPEHFSGFDVKAMTDTVEFESVMEPLALQARAFADHLDKAILKNRTQPAEDTLTVYALLKGFARVKANESVREHVRELKSLINRRNTKKKKATVSTNAGVTATAATPATTVHAPAPAAAAAVASPAATSRTGAASASA